MAGSCYESDHCNSNGVVVTTGGSPANRLGVIRAFGRRNIPVVYLDSEPGSIVRYSKYITTRLKCPDLKKSETEYVNTLLDFGRQINGRMMIIPSGDRDVLALAKYKQKLEQFYSLPVASFETTQKLVNKKEFYKWLARKRIPHPKTHFSENIDALQTAGLDLPFPYIIKPAYSHAFQEVFGRKCFVINSAQDLDYAIKRLRAAPELEVMIQEIIPGQEIYAFYTYLDRKSEPLGVCGYDKIRHWPVDFGSGSFCTSKGRPSLIKQCVELLQEIGYHGFAEPELKKDPRDGVHKLLEINARTTLQNRLPASCGTDIEYVAYLDASGKYTKSPVCCNEGIPWVDDFADLQSILTQARQKQTRISALSSSLKPGTVHSIASLHDPAPFIIHSIRSAAARGAKHALQILNPP
jgi:predicted ATP-grasp superfamily ATP-dependent carboligase